MHFAAHFSPPFAGAVTKILRVVKITAFILLIACLQVSARGYGQRVTLRVKHASLETVLAEIQKQTGFNFIYARIELENAKPVDLDVKDADLRQVLVQCFKDQPLAYTIEDQYVVVKKKTVEASIQRGVGDSSKPREIEVNGRVTNQQGEPLVGATVIVKNGKKGVVTNEKGLFEIKHVPFNAVLEISYTGYQQRDVAVDGLGMILVELAVANNSLDGIQVIAYGQTTQRLSVGDVTTISGTAIERQPVNNPLLALEGQVPGLFITQSTGLSGGAVIAQIQGQNSIQQGNDPFYVVDGVPYVSQFLPNLGGGLSGTLLGPNYNQSQEGSPFSYINPADIESISVLKDADATAIYGSRAANGAILITTKKGKAGRTKVDFNLQQGWGHVTRRLNLLNTPEYLEMRREAISNDGDSLSDPNLFAPDLLQWDTTRYTDWQKTLIGGTAQYTNLGMTISGGNATTQYLVGGNFHRETTVFPGSFADQKGSLHFNINNVSTNQRFKFQLSGNYLVDDNQLPSFDLTSIAITTPPDGPSLYNKDGSLDWAPNSSGTSTWYNPIANLYSTYSNKGNNLISNAVMSYEVLPGLNIRGSFGYTNLQTTETIITPLIALPPESRPYAQRSAQYGDNDINSWIVEPQVAYKFLIGNGKVEALAGTTINEINGNGQQLMGIGYNSDQVLGDIHSASSVSVTSTVASVYKYNALFGRLAYNLNDKYLINLSARRDGSSRFGPANEFHDFWATGAGWIFSKEEFLQNELKFLSFGKLRVSYGTTGNDQIGNYGNLSQYVPTYAQVAYQSATGLTPIGLTNPYLQWEETKKAEAGIDLGFLKDRLLLNTTYFQNRSSNQLLGYSLPIITGFTSITKNLPATVENMGWQLTLNTINVKTKNFGWSTHVNLTIPENKLISFPNLATSGYSSSLIVGKSISIKELYHLVGVNDTTGIYQFSSKSGPTYNPVYGTDNTVIINSAPKFYGGIQNSLNYKGFQLDILFQFVKQVGLNYKFGSEVPGHLELNQPISVLDRWQKIGDEKPIEKYSNGYSLYGAFGDAQNSDAAYSDASYVKLKNLSISWQLPATWTKRLSLQYFRVYVQAQNLLTITHYDGIDPENMSTGSLPPLRVLTMGVQVGL